MNAPVRTLLKSFDDLSESDKHEVVIEILRRTARVDAGALPAESLVAMADHIFLELDAREAADADPSPR